MHDLSIGGTDQDRSMRDIKLFNGWERKENILKYVCDIEVIRGA